MVTNGFALTHDRSLQIYFDKSNLIKAQCIKKKIPERCQNQSNFGTKILVYIPYLMTKVLMIP